MSDVRLVGGLDREVRGNGLCKECGPLTKGAKGDKANFSWPGGNKEDYNTKLDVINAIPNDQVQVPARNQKEPFCEEKNGSLSRYKKPLQLPQTLHRSECPH